MSHSPTFSRHPEWRSVDSLAGPYSHGLIAVSAAMRDLIGAIEHLARYRTPVLIVGEAGTGKQAIAEVLHALGSRPDGPLIKLDCASLTVTNAASQLFGSAVNSFGGAAAIDPGCFHLAEGGSLLLNEVGDLPFGLQGKLLRAVENLEIQPAGSPAPIHLDVRLIASTRRDLAALAKVGGFRPDLYYRLAAASVTAPPLRNRGADLEPLIAALIASYNRLFGKRVDAISAAALALLRAWRWPGNLRELAHALERAILLCDNDRIDADDLPATIGENDALSMPACGPRMVLAAGAAPLRNNEVNEGVVELGQLDGSRLPSQETANPSSNPPLNLDYALKHAIARSLAAARGDCAKAAAMVGVSRTAFHQKMVRYGLTAPSPEHGAHPHRASPLRTRPAQFSD